MHHVKNIKNSLDTHSLDRISLNWSKVNLKLRKSFLRKSEVKSDQKFNQGNERTALSTKSENDVTHAIKSKLYQ